MPPVSVSFQLTAPEEPTVGALNVALIPLGNPETIDTLAPLPLDGAVSVPCGVTVTVRLPVPIEGMESTVCDSCILTDGAGSTITVYCQETVKPSPVAVTVKVYQFAGTELLAESFSVDEPIPEVKATELLLHDAVTPLGRPDTARLAFP